MEFALSTSTSTKPQIEKHYSIGKEMMMMIMMYIHKVCKCNMVSSLEGNKSLVA
jgi:ABC-type lipoprotein release transport system permease subunit